MLSPADVAITSLDDAWAAMREAARADRDIERFVITHDDFAALRSRPDIWKYYNPDYHGGIETLFGIPLQRIRPR